MPITTRSQSKEASTHIDFDEASRAWRANKTHIGNGAFIYKSQSNNPYGLHSQSPWLPVEESSNRSQRTRKPPIRYNPSS